MAVIIVVYVYNNFEFIWTKHILYKYIFQLYLGLGLNITQLSPKKVGIMCD